MRAPGSGLAIGLYERPKSSRLSAPEDAGHASIHGGPGEPLPPRAQRSAAPPSLTTPPGERAAGRHTGGVVEVSDVRGDELGWNATPEGSCDARRRAASSGSRGRAAHGAAEEPRLVVEPTSAAAMSDAPDPGGAVAAMERRRSRPRGARATTAIATLSPATNVAPAWATEQMVSRRRARPPAASHAGEGAHLGGAAAQPGQREVRVDQRALELRELAVEPERHTPAPRSHPVSRTSCQRLPLRRSDGERVRSPDRLAEPDGRYACAACWRLSPACERVPARGLAAGATSPSGGISVRQFSGTSSSRPVTSRAFGQRGWNGQPGGGSTGDGTSPLRTIRC